MTLHRHFSFFFPEEMDGSLDYPFVRSLFLGIRPSKSIEKSVIKILVNTPIPVCFPDYLFSEKPVDADLKLSSGEMLVILVFWEFI